MKIEEFNNRTLSGGDDEGIYQQGVKRVRV